MLHQKKLQQQSEVYHTQEGVCVRYMRMEKRNPIIMNTEGDAAE
jgi:hypothetical protein